MQSAATDIIALEQNMHNCAYTKIHITILQLIPYLEQRQELCKKYVDYNNSEDVNKNLVEAKSYMDDKIKIILGIKK